MLKKRRLDLEMTQYDLAKAAGVNQTRISLAERGLVELAEWEKIGLGEVLGIPAPELFSKIGERESYRELRRFLTIEEKAWLLDVGCDLAVYRERLIKLGKKYGIIPQGANDHD
jgi:transcriptional regulator with XRE-family HTH domain